MGVATLEFGVCLHSVIIGLTLAVTEDSGFDVLFIVIIFHQVRSPLLYAFLESSLTSGKSDFSRSGTSYDYRCLRVSVSVLVSQVPSAPPRLTTLTRCSAREKKTGLAFLRLQRQYSWIPWIGACLYSLCTPLGMAIGLGVREGLVRTARSPESKTFSNADELHIRLLAGLDGWTEHEWRDGFDHFRSPRRDLVRDLALHCSG